VFDFTGGALPKEAAMDPPLVQVETTIKASPDKVWRTITQKPGALFMGAQVDTDWQVGHPITMSGEYQGHAFKDTGEIRSFSPRQELSFTHVSGGQTRNGGNLVSLKLEPDGDASRVTLSQTPIGASAITEETRRQFEQNWKQMLEALKAEAER
jgi:uncharacterized protein YndB with AHSA1/START domain